jgi:hypothetical protein
MNPLLQDFIGTILRKALTSVAVFLVTYGWITPEQSEAYVAGLVLFLLGLGWSLWQKYKERLWFLTAIIAPANSTEAEVKALSKTESAPSVTKTMGVLLVCALSLSMLSACGGGMKRAPVLVAQASLAAGQTIGQLQRTIKSLTQTSDGQGVIPVRVALNAQQTLLDLNGNLELVPPLLRSIDAAQQSGTVDQSQVIQAITLLQKVSADLSIVVAGIPLNDATKQVLTLIQSGQTTVTTLLVQLGKIQAAFGTAKFEPVPLWPYYAEGVERWQRYSETMTVEEIIY